MRFLSVAESSLRTKLRRAIVAAPSLVLLLAALVFWTLTRQTLTEESSLRARIEIEALARSVDAFLDRAAILARGIASRQSAIGREPDPKSVPILRSLLEAIYSADPADPVQGVYLAFEQRDYREPDAIQWVDRVHWGTNSRVDYDYHDRDANRQWYWGAREKQPDDTTVNITEPYFDEGGGNTWMVSVTQPVRDANGEFVGVAGVDLDMERLQRLIQQLSVMSDSATSSVNADYAYLVSPKGKVFALPERIQSRLGGKSWEPVALEGLPGAEASLLRDRTSGVNAPVRTPSGEARLLSWKTFRSNWKVVVNKAEGPVYAPARRVTVQTLAAGSVLLALMVGIVALIADRVIGPIPRLTAAAQAVENGDYHADGLADVARRRDEFGQLARGFRRMVEVVSGRESELRHAQDELAGRERYFRALIENATDIVTVIDPDGLIRSKSPSVRRILGWYPDELVGQSAREYVHPEDQTRVLELFERLKSDPGGSRTSEYRFRHKDGSYRVLEANSTNLIGDPAVRGIVVNSRDVTERHRAALQLRELNAELEGRVKRRTAELEQKNEELHSAKEATEQAMKQQEIFLSNVAHDLRTPLTIVIGFSEDLLRRARKKKVDAFVPDLQLIVNRGKDLLEMINDLLNLSKSMNDKELSLDIEEFDLAELLRSRMEGIGSIAEKYGNTIAFEPEESLGLMTADKAKVWRVLMNLLTNACKFTKDGSIRVEARRVVGPDGGPDRVVLEVSDTGIGMSAEKQKLLFNRFSQVHSGERAGKAGASFGLSSVGLGLSICMLYCRAMGGRISVESEEGRGSTFTVELPTVPACSATVPAPRPLPSPPSPEPVAVSTPRALPVVSDSPTPRTPDEAAGSSTGVRANLVLIIDDDASVCELIGRNLGEEGYKTRAAYNGEEGLRLAREILPSAIVLDVVMPGIDGWGVLAALKTDARTAEIPIIMVSMLDERERGLSLGADEYVSKPLAGERLPKILADHLGGRPTPRVLIVEDDPEARELLTRSLTERGWDVTSRGDGASALAAMREHRPDLMLLDLLLPGTDGFEVIREVRREPSLQTIPIIVMTAAVLSPEERRRLQEQVQKVLYKGLYSRDELFQEILNSIGGDALRPARDHREVTHA